MKQFEGQGLEEVYELATAEFECSITDLNINIVQQAKKGFFGFGRKPVIIEVSYKRKQKTNNSKFKDQKLRTSSMKIEDVSKKLEASSPKMNTNKKTKLKKPPQIESKEEIFDNFYTKDEEELSKLIVKKDKDTIIDEVKEKVNYLFSHTCYDINTINVEFYNEETLYIEFSGKDSALLIGKEGYRYKALSYILFNWVNESYNLMLRLEVAEFLKNQEQSIYNYLEPVIETIKENGTFKTKPLDGILVHIALQKLRDEFPNKYVAVKTNIKGDKYVLVNEYRSKQ